MNSIVEQINNDILMHYGMPRRSGRYPWGSGEEPYQHGSRDFLSRVEELKKNGWTETPENIMKEFGLTTTQYRTEKSNALDERKLYRRATIQGYLDEGKGWTEIGRLMGMPEATVRSMMNQKSDAKNKQARNTADFIKEQIDSRGMIDVGNGVELELGISKEKLKQALKLLEEEGYPIYKGGIPQATNPGKQTNQMVICPPGTEHKDIYQYDKVHSLKEYVSNDGGNTFNKKFTYPTSMDSKRVFIRYSEDGGLEKDGIIELRRGVPDLSLGNSRYSQVRILLDDKMYAKGMAVYADDIPDGYDMVFNTNRKAGSPHLSDDPKVPGVFKKIKNDPDNPFGSLIKDAEQGGQYWYDDPKTGEKKLGLINKRSDEGDWTEWADALPSQFLSKQSKNMAEKQLNLAKSERLEEFDKICKLENPTIKKHLLNKFADECDGAAVHLKAAALPGQKYHVIVPINTLKDTEIYAPGYKEGTKLALIRYPHGGTFEIPILTVNNRNKLGEKIIGPHSIDAVGITKKIADQLSGADFDGDTVMCIPTHDKNGRIKIASTPGLDGLKDFDAKEKYPYREGMKMMKDPITGKDATPLEMGMISNLITDMTLAGATDDEKAAAVRHSQVVIDAAKHKLDYKQSEVDNNIKALKKKYQGGPNAGAATIISRAKGQQSVLKRQGNAKVNLKDSPDYDPTKPEGSLIWKTSDKASWETTEVNKRTGKEYIKTHYKHQKSTKMAETEDAYTLISEARHPMEIVYADYANSMKDLARQARIEASKTGKIAYDRSAKNEYAQEVRDLNDKLNNALVNHPREREAQRRTNAEVNAKIAAYKDETGQKMKPGDVKKLKQQAISKYRDEVDAVSRRKRNITITDREWEAIQKGAVSENTLKKILDNTDTDELRKRATPRDTNTISAATVNRIKALGQSNFTISEIADKMNLSKSTVMNYLKGEN